MLVQLANWYRGMAPKHRSPKSPSGSPFDLSGEGADYRDRRGGRAAPGRGARRRGCGSPALWLAAALDGGWRRILERHLAARERDPLVDERDEAQDDERDD